MNGLEGIKVVDLTAYVAAPACPRILGEMGATVYKIEPFTDVYKRQMISDLYPSDVTTKDKKVMTVDSFVIWDINDPVKYLSSLNASKEKAEVRLGNVVYNSIKNVLSSTKMCIRDRDH